MQGRLLHRLQEEEHIGRTAARHRRHRIDLRLIIQPHGLADRAHHGVGLGALGLAHAGLRRQAGHAHADQRRRVRHRAHDGVVAVQPARQVAAADAGGDRQHQLAVQQWCQLGRDFAHLLRLDRQHHDFALPDLFVDRRGGAHAVLLRQALQRFRVAVDDVDVRARTCLPDDTRDECGCHIAATDERDLHVFSCYS